MTTDYQPAPPLFASNPPRARRTDPATSKEAAAKIADIAHTQQLETLQAVIDNPGRTTRQIADITGMQVHMLGRRMSELWRAGRVRSGEPAKQANGRRGLTWFAVEESR